MVIFISSASQQRSELLSISTKKTVTYLVGAELHDDVDIFFVFEDVLKLNHMPVVERFVDLDLCL